MWEHLATTRRQDRVLHGAAKALNVLVGLIALPVWLLGQKLVEPLRRLLARFDDAERELPTPAAGERSMAALMVELEAIPQDLRPRPFAEVRKGFADLSTFVLSQLRETSGLGYAYPAQFTDHVYEGADGERIAATIAVHDAPRPGLVVVHGLFTSRRFDYVRQIAVTAFYEWGFNVAAVDLRSFGLTNYTSAAPSSAGWKEGQDLVRLGRYMKDLGGTTTVGALGISLGGCSVLDASDADDAAQALDGGILAVSPPARPREVAERLSRKLPRTHPAYALNYAFHAMLTSRARGSGWPAEIATLLDPVDQLSAPYYEVDADELWERAAPVNHLGGARVPVLVLHPEDDQIIKVDEARALAEAAAGNDLVRVWILPAGKHGILDAIDYDWTYAVYRRFFERWARYPGQEPSEVVYSPDAAGYADPGNAGS